MCFKDGCIEMFTPQILTNVINHKLNYINLNQQFDQQLLM